MSILPKPRSVMDPTPKNPFIKQNLKVFSEVIMG
jgi:hypothetical protein